MSAPISKSLGKLSFERSSTNNEKDKHRKRISNQYFNSHSDTNRWKCNFDLPAFPIHVLIPGCEKLPSTASEIVLQHKSYMVKHLPLHMLLDPDFINGFVKQGSLYMLSHGTCVDSDDCAAIIPTGHLILSLCKDSYEELGLAGERSKRKYVVKIDLTAFKFSLAPGHYKHVMESLRDRLNVHFNFLVTWLPNDEKICPSSIQNYFKCRDVVCNSIQIHQTLYQYQNITVPVFSSDSFCPDTEMDMCNYLDVYEWLGACAIGAEMSDRKADDYISTYACPSPNEIIKYGIGVQFKGMFSPFCIQKLIDELCEYIKSKSIPWFAVTVHGFMDSPIAWGKHHGFYSNGDNLYTFVMFNNEDYWQYSAMNSF